MTHRPLLKMGPSSSNSSSFSLAYRGQERNVVVDGDSKCQRIRTTSQSLYRLLPMTRPFKHCARTVQSGRQGPGDSGTEDWCHRDRHANRLGCHSIVSRRRRDYHRCNYQLVQDTRHPRTFVLPWLSPQLGKMTSQMGNSQFALISRRRGWADTILGE